ncbi:nicotinate-nucleotide adenylyltransferase [Granulicella aggregans]|uniref:Probable nicotinate-nucleotide adenylyltransferase n=1 Tax=Granulicella aggregans TaxID=474949 RepID=A0A7W8E2R8_9BACT|nr:nicotinate-nucleotide adenylyltransferase [Granulicella aggregans]MBB5057183.1 nicotinate-nucleotide adenylyltransferase [Granulicella aggregans]
MRIALFGGTFDPPHRGHIAIAKAAANAFALDRVLFAPTGLQPLKLGRAPSPFETRLTLAKAACEEDPRFEATGIDAPHPDGSANYTVDTLTELARLYSADTLFNLVGADSFLNLRKWREPDRLLELAEWIAVSRPGYALMEEDLVPLRLSQGQRSRVHVLNGIAEDTSATDLRKRLREGDPCRDLLPNAVAAYVKRSNLYRNVVD